MGVSIHYSGYILSEKLIDPLIEEVTDICETLNWSTHSFDDEEIKGVSFSPEGSEPVFLTFDKEGRTLSPINICLKDIYDGLQLNKELIFTISTKTHYAGVGAHIAIIKLLKHLSAKYFKDFTVTDEGYYWETGDVKILVTQFEKVNLAMDIFSDGLKDLRVIDSETAESLCNRLERLLRDRFGKEKE
jgi:hypothetical protein